MTSINSTYLALLLAAACIASTAHAAGPAPAPATDASVVQTESNVPDSQELQMLSKAIVKMPFELTKNKKIDEQFRKLAAQSGWTFLWQASEYMLDHNVTLPPEFEPAIASFLRSANESGARLRATFYRGNKTVRIEEF